MPQAKVCPDCNSTVPAAPSAAYCAHCGQRLDVRPLSLPEILNEALGTLWTLELPILRTTRDMLRGPGPVARAWLDGRRRTYINPLKFLVILGTVLALTYGPIAGWQQSLTPAGTAVVTSGFEMRPGIVAFTCIGLLLPIAILAHWIARLLRVHTRWLEIYALGLYCYGLGTMIQLVLLLVDVALLWASVDFRFDSIRGLVPIPLFAWGAYGFAPHGARGRCMLAVFLAQVVFFAAFIAVVALLQSR